MAGMPPGGGAATGGRIPLNFTARDGTAVIDPFWTMLAAKMATTAAIVVVASRIVERSGPFVGAMVATLPISAGPSYAFLAAEHGARFIERASLTSLAINGVTFGFGALYALLARARPLPIALGAAFGLWLVAAILVVRTPWTLETAGLLNAVVFAPSFLATRACRAATPVRPPQPRWWDVPFRASLVMGLVGATVALGRFLGPAAAGVAALVPIVMFSLAVILQPRIGGRGASAVLANTLPGLVGFGLAVAILHVTVLRIGAPLALLGALAVCVGWNASLALLRRLPLKRGRDGAAAATLVRTEDS